MRLFTCRHLLLLMGTIAAALDFARADRANAVSASMSPPRWSDEFYQSFLDPTQWTLHTQATTVSQGHFAFHSLYEGPHSLETVDEARTSFTTTEFIGRRVWQGGLVVFNPEIIGGQGDSHTLGVAGNPNGETYRVANTNPTLQLSRLYFQQRWDLSNTFDKQDSAPNQLAEPLARHRLTFVMGRFSLADFFDNNTYSHDPRTQFLNWSLMSNGAWDYAADTRGYTWGFYAEYHNPVWSLRGASVLVPKEANGLALDTRIGRARADQVEAEWDYASGERPGVIRALSYVNHADMGNYDDALTASPVDPDVTQTRAYRTKYGFGLNWEQALTSDLGIFARAGWNNGTSETWAYTEVDNTVSAGLNGAGDRWGRAEDRIGLAAFVNGLSPSHRHYLSAGGDGFILGDGALTYAPEQGLETYYALHVWRYWTLTTDIQGLRNPGYNADRGPVAVFSERVHLEF